MYKLFVSLMVKETFKDIKMDNQNRKSKKNKQCNGHFTVCRERLFVSFRHIIFHKIYIIFIIKYVNPIKIFNIPFSLLYQASWLEV
jgi:hypothetical protein